ncbi:hypothetical protein L596_021745 [Steinernema carpocapsae]|uniref:Uncharacterized protein n=1 Tax=Steinernema carpocapsae TaxID=34508 RepID=A0A4V6A006_STECR|nr:hypothetical protein L596_021745 [Steinernema carpocapsae]
MDEASGVGFAHTTAFMRAEKHSAEATDSKKRFNDRQNPCETFPEAKQPVGNVSETVAVKLHPVISSRGVIRSENNPQTLKNLRLHRFIPK